jgi:hypothetical protein
MRLGRFELPRPVQVTAAVQHYMAKRDGPHRPLEIPGARDNTVTTNELSCGHPRGPIKQSGSASNAESSRRLRRCCVS